MKLINYRCKVKALQLSWIDRLCRSDSNWVSFPRYFFNCEHLCYIFGSEKSKCTLSKLPQFYKEIYQLFIKYISVNYQSNKDSAFLPVWYNINPKKVPKIYHKCIKKGLTVIENLLDEKGNLMTTKEINKKFKMNMNLIQHHTLISNIQKEQLKRDHLKRQPPVCIGIPFENKIICSTKCKTKIYYWHIMNTNVYPEMYNFSTKWGKIIESTQDMTSIDWENIHSLSHQYCKNSKFLSFQYKIIHHTISCRKWLFERHVKGIENNLCKFCNKEDNLVHFFINCKQVINLWIQINKWLVNCMQYNFLEWDNTYEKILLGHLSDADNSKAINMFILLVKYYIYQQKQLFALEKAIPDFSLYGCLKYIKHQLNLLCAKTTTVTTINPFLETIKNNI